MFRLALAAGLSAGVASAADLTVGEPKKGNIRFFEKHVEFLKRAEAGPVGVLFLGDSITEGWGRMPELWASAWGRYEPANFGIGGDQVQHVIWRVEQGELDKISPKVVVLMIGTNNTGQHTADEIIAGNRRLVELIRETVPETKVLLLGIFPRGPRNLRDGTPEPWEMRMEKINAINAEMATWDDGETVRYLDIGSVFRDADGNIPKDIMPDQLHLSAAGYRRWVEAMSPLLTEMVE